MNSGRACMCVCEEITGPIFNTWNAPSMGHRSSLRPKIDAGDVDRATADTVVTRCAEAVTID